MMPTIEDIFESELEEQVVAVSRLYMAINTRILQGTVATA